MRSPRSSRAVWILLAIWPLAAAWNPLDRPNRAVESGNVSMQQGKAEEALGRYDQAVSALPSDPGVHFNRGTALMSLSRHEEAIGELMRATEVKNTSLKAAAFYNLGNAYFKSDRFADAIAAYKRSLGLVPGDMRAKWNLELALQKKQEEDKKKQEQDNKDQDKKDQDKNKDDQNKQDKDQKKDQKKDDKQDQQKQDEQKQDQQKQDEQKQDQQKQDEQKQDQPQPQQEEKPQEQPQSKDDKAPEMREINAVLDSLERSPKDLEKMRARLRAVRRAPPAKDW
jgi:Ca-activated chloride channel family protein